MSDTPTTHELLPAAGRRMAVVVAHPDDETFGCGSLIALATSAGAHVTVICATRGEAGERLPDPATAALPLGELRERELRLAAAVLGVDDVQVLDHHDSGFSGPAPAGALVGVPAERLATELVSLLAPIGPDVVLTLDGSDGHRDHVHLRDALTLAAARLDHRPRVVHSCLARSLMNEWAAAMRAAQPDREHLALPELGRPDAELTAIDTSSVLAIREAALAHHRSQSSPFEQLPADLRRRMLSVDHVVVI